MKYLAVYKKSQRRQLMSAETEEISDTQCYPQTFAHSRQKSVNDTER